jgi:outer membrane biogenesis lipoprotein LolB
MTIGFMKTFWMCFAAVLLLGCSPSAQNPAGEEQKSAVQDVVNTMSQRNALESGRKAGQQIRAIRADQDKNLQETESE